MAALVCGAGVEDIADAGFVDLYEGQFEVYGKSMSLGKEADGSTNQLLNEQVETMKVYDLNSQCRWFATNRETEHELVGTGLDSMRKFKIF
jgi:hypothetical protein